MKRWLLIIFLWKESSVICFIWWSSIGGANEFKSGRKVLWKWSTVSGKVFSLKNNLNNLRWMNYKDIEKSSILVIQKSKINKVYGKNTRKVQHYFLYSLKSKACFPEWDLFHRGKRERLMAEVIKVVGDLAYVQVFEHNAMVWNPECLLNFRITCWKWVSDLVCCQKNWWLTEWSG